MPGTPTDDLVAIQGVIARYSVVATLRDAAGISALFTDDGVWEVPPPVGMEFRGAATIGPSIVESLGAFTFLVQMAHPSAIDVDGDRATARTVIEEVGELGATKDGFRMFGVYNDELERTDAGWRFARRRFDTIHVETGTPIEDLAAAANGA